MKKMQKVIVIIVSAILALILVVVIAIGIFGNSALKAGIETAGSEALGVTVSVNDVDLSILGGQLEFKGLVIDNPPGYKHDKFLELGEVKVKVEIKSLLSDVVNIEEIILDGVNITLEQKGITSNNLKDILKKISSKEKDPQAESAEPSGKKLHIDNLEITNLTVKAKLLSIPDVTLTLSPIKMTDLGADDKMDLAVLSSKILMAIAGGIAEKGAGLLPDEMMGPLTDQLKNLGQLSKTLFKEGGEVGGKVLEEGKDIGKSITEGLKGLFKPKE